MNEKLIEYLETRTYGQLLADAVHAIRVLKHMDKWKLTDLRRDALCRFPGFGPIARVFHEARELNGQEKAAQAEVQDMLTRDEFIQARSSTLTAYYTPPRVIQRVWGTALRLLNTRDPITVLEPGCGIGNFALYAPPLNLRVGRRSKGFVGVEMEPISAAIAKALGWGDIYNKDFMKWPWPETSPFDLAIGNVPFIDGMTDGHGTFTAKVELHCRIILRCLDAVRPGGVVALVTSTGTLDSKGSKGQNTKFRQYVEARAQFLGAVRLPMNALKAYKTSTCTDILFLRVRQPGDDRPSVPWINRGESGVVNHEGKPTFINEYFIAHPEQMLGEPAIDKTKAGDKFAVVLGKDQEFLPLLDAALARISD